MFNFDWKNQIIRITTKDITKNNFDIEDITTYPLFLSLYQKQNVKIAEKIRYFIFYFCELYSCQLLNNENLKKFFNRY